MLFSKQEIKFAEHATLSLLRVALPVVVLYSLVGFRERDPEIPLAIVTHIAHPICPISFHGEFEVLGL